MPEEWSKARQIGFQYVQSLVLADWGSTQIVEFLTGEGVGYRWSAMFDDIRRLKGEAVSSQYVKRLDPDEFVPRRYIGERPTDRWGRPERLRYRMEAVFRDPETGDEETQYLALMTNKELTVGAAIREGRPLFSVDVSGIPGELVSIELVGLFHKEGTPY